MARIEVGPSASADLTDIAAYLRRHAGNRVVDTLEVEVAVALRRLAAHPESGAPRPALGRGTRIVTIKPYVVLHRYDPGADTVFVLRVLHGRRRLALDAS